MYRHAVAVSVMFVVVITATMAFINLLYNNFAEKSAIAKKMASAQDISEAEQWLDADAYLQEQQVWAHGSLNCKCLFLQMFQHAAATGGRTLAWHQGAGGPPVNPTIMAGELASGQHDAIGEGKSGSMMEGGQDNPSWGWRCGPWVLTTNWVPSPTAFGAGRACHCRCHHCHYSHLLRIQIPPHWVHPNG